MREGMTKTMSGLSRRSKMAVVMSVDACIASITLWLTYVATEQSFFPAAVEQHWWLLPLASITTVTVFWLFRLYHTVIRFAGAQFFMHTIVASVLVAWIVGVCGLLKMYPTKPISIFVIYPFYLMVACSTSRLVARRVFDYKVVRDSKQVVCAIYGAGSGGVQLYSAIRFGGTYDPVAFIDDDTSTHGLRVHGLKVWSPDKLQQLINKKHITTILLAIPSLEQRRRAEIVKRMLEFNLSIESTPSFSDLVTNRATFGDLRPLSMEDILTRTEMEPDEHLARKCVHGKSVMVTGAGGSIGSELCRQIIQRKPTKLVLFDIAESALFYIEQELLQRLKKLDSEIYIVPVLGSVTDKNRLQEVLLQHEVSTVFHAAAYKHVPMLELNPLEGARNNILGTNCVFEAAAWANCSSLVVVSTDKAVRPTSFMGATKRFAELVVQAKSSAHTNMNTCLVRFGNVLGSSGSVVPIFEEQIRIGGPVTVTDQHATRYFMTIPEASQLVMQAGAMGSDSEVFVLDMGEPIRILDLAKRMIELAGRTLKTEENPAGDIEITFSELRPGEKLHEELAFDADLIETDHPMIRLADEPDPDVDQIIDGLKRIEGAIEQADIGEIVASMQELIPGFTPSWGIENPTINAAKQATRDAVKNID
jgi:FlaA1/EpsC-like NDP-sugar epimerase